MSKTDLISIGKIEKAIYVIRGEKVMLDRDLAELYQVQTKALNQAVRRNSDRFPTDFMFQLSGEEVDGAEPVTICDRFTEASGSALQALCVY